MPRLSSDRRRRSAASRRSYRLEVRLTPAEARAWIECASSLGIDSVSDLVRQAVGRYIEAAAAPRT